MGKLIHRLCACGCGGTTNPGRRYIYHHHRKNVSLSKEHKKKISLSMDGLTHSEETKKKMSFTAKNRSEEIKLKMAISSIKAHPDDEYCEAWRDREYKKDLRKNYCENTECQGISKNFLDHHINLNKQDCRPSNVMTLCRSCHPTLHWKLSSKNKTNYKDYLTIIKQDRITYIHKKTRKKITLKRRINKKWGS